MESTDVMSLDQLELAQDCETDIKVEIKEELEEYDDRLSSTDIGYMQNELSTEVNIEDIKTEIKNENDSGFED
ncbi:uncharacterized protein LOC114330290 isoform X3 [Diabrotica virgifera virgifera]|uniref:Uncharacterized protein LOC114330290 isoform X2 n=1 Tax=Diabrotica virgifera virgifera TaxID=50390 RepID=A0A6P7FR22_DIAVI|nr:uncharacterized protein LOC114330290 isoform X3 [Diabrotica virgifera virgifera]